MVGVIWYRFVRCGGTDWSDTLVPIHPLQWYRFADIIRTSIYAVQHMLGHKNVATTQIDADMADETKRQSVDRITLKPRITPTLKVVNQ